VPEAIYTKMTIVLYIIEQVGSEKRVAVKVEAKIRFVIIEKI
jgi:hypothetical protein